MKKTLTSLIVGMSLAVSTTSAVADDLMQVYQQALTNDPVLLKAAAQFEASKEGIEQARAVLLPQISATGSYTETDVDNIARQNNGFGIPDGAVYTAENDNVSYGASLSMQLYHHDTWLRLDNAEKSAHQADLAYQIAQQDLIIRVSEAYFNLLSAKDTLEFAEAQKVAIERQLEQTKQRFSVGLTAITDVHEAQAQFDDSVTQVIRAQNDIYNAEEAIRVLTNVYPRDIFVLNTDRFSASRPMPDSANEWQQTAEAKSLDIISQKVSVDIAKENINIARAGHYPTLDLSGRFSNSEDTFRLPNIPEIEDPDLDTKSIGITLTVPIYSGGATSSAVRQAQHSYVAASQDLQFAYRDTVRKTRNAYNTVIAGVSAIKALEQSVLSAEKALEATEAGFEVGTRTIVDVLNSTRNLYDAKRNLSSTRYLYINSILGLKRAAGTLTGKDLQDINAGLAAEAAK
ncbi:outer membrane channel protein TolC [Thalassotalea euphylliae]|uniref:Outer membrane channel protein TolC n=1 Tax=Thalassotalea euphylliae TaxID=1655234 RepID=A0A3E0TTS3_9GAMM|nr:outer membrane channel protein TolC [Thalassotalea euphylliae]REL27948.1 outer membrane channel protein TolC [Thalassotalea euphylliae]